MSELVARFCAEYHAYKNVGRDRRATQEKLLLEFEAHVGGDLTTATGADLTAFLAAKLETRKPTTVRWYLGMIRPFYTWAWRNGLVDAERRMRIMDVEPPRGGRGSAPRPYGRDDLRRFWRDLDDTYPLLTGADAKFIKRWRNGSTPWKRVQRHAQRLQTEAIVSLALYGGLRRDEIWRLEFEEMHPEGDVVIARSQKNREGVWVTRSVPMFPPMRDAIGNWFEFREWIGPDTERPWLSLWYQYHDWPATLRSFRLTLSKVGRGWELHRFRHTAATELLRARMPIEKVQKIMGHATIQQTLAYVQLLDDDVLEAAWRAERQYVQNIERTRRAA